MGVLYMCCLEVVSHPSRVRGAVKDHPQVIGVSPAMVDRLASVSKGSTFFFSSPACI
jgi:hypothetical protein